MLQRPDSPTLLKRLDPWLSPLAQLGGRALHHWPGRNEAPAPPLLVRPGGLGDLICAHMAVEESGLAPASFLWLIERRSAAWADHAELPHLCYDATSAITPRALFGRHQLVIDTEQRFGLSRALARAATRPGGTLVGFGTNRGGRHGDVTVPYDPQDEHEVCAFSRLLAAGGLGTGGLASPPVRARMAPVGGPPVVGIAGLQSPSRRLRAGDWVALVDSWADGEEVLVSAAPADRHFAEEVTARVATRAQLIEGSLSTVVAAIERAPRVLTMDGGLVHVASYAGIPTTAIFTSGRESKWAPLAHGSHVFRHKSLPCQPCTVFGQTPPCPNDLRCLDIRAFVEVGPET